LLLENDVISVYLFEKFKAIHELIQIVIDPKSHPGKCKKKELLILQAKPDLFVITTFPFVLSLFSIRVSAS